MSRARRDADQVISAAVAARANMIVSGDRKHLLPLAATRAFPSPSQPGRSGKDLTPNEGVAAAGEKAVSFARRKQTRQARKSWHEKKPITKRIGQIVMTNGENLEMAMTAERSGLIGQIGPIESMRYRISPDYPLCPIRLLRRQMSATLRSAHKSTVVIYNT